MYETKGQVIVYEGDIIHAFFFSSSNGKTNNSEDYWAKAYPHLGSVESNYDAIEKDNTRVKEITKNQINKIFGMNVESIEIVEYFESAIKILFNLGI